MDPQPSGTDSSPLAATVEPPETAPAPAERGAVPAGAAVGVEWEPGTVLLDLYEVEEFLGQGGFGCVYRVFHRDWGVDLSVKVPRADRLNPAGLERVTREAETWVNLELHPHAVSCYYVRSADGIPLVFAEYVSGGSLASWIGTRKLYAGDPRAVLARILDIAIQCAWGVAFSHGGGVVHRDLKPSNVMMTVDGLAKVTDFGLARAIHDSGGDALLTPAYCSPEQARGEAVTAATDVWSWGLTVLEMFAGGRFWVVGEVAPLALEHYLREGSHAGVRMPERLAALLRECFQEAPGERPVDLGEVAAALRDLYRAEVELPYPRGVPPSRADIADTLNNRAVSLLDLGRRDEAEAILDQVLRAHPLHLEATYNRGLLAWRSGQQDDSSLLLRLKEAKRSNGHDPSAAHLLALVHMERGDPAAAVETLEAVQLSAATPLLARARDELPRSRGLARTLGVDEGLATPIALSPDGRYALAEHGSPGSRKRVMLWDAREGRCLGSRDLALRGGDDRAEVRVAVLDIDGRYVVFVRGPGVWRWDLHTDECLRLFLGDWLETANARLSGDGRFVASRSGPWHEVLRVWDVASGVCVQALPVADEPPGRTQRVSSLCLSEDGRYLAAGLPGGHVRLWEVRTGRSMRGEERHGGPVQRVAFSRDGSRLASACRGEMKVWDAGTGTCVWTTIVPHGVDTLRFGHDSAHLVTAGAHGMLQVWDVGARRCLCTCTDPVGHSVPYVFSADGRYALSGDEKLKLWRLDGPVYLAPPSLKRFVESEASARLVSAYEQSLALAREACGGGDHVSAARHVRDARGQPGFERGEGAVAVWGELYRHLPRASLRGGWETAVHVLPEMSGNAILSPDGRYVLYRDLHHALVLREIEEGSFVRGFVEHTAPSFSASFSHDGRHLLSGAWGNDTPRLWEVATGRCLHRFGGLGYGRKVAALSPDGRFAVIAASGALRLYEAARGELLHDFGGAGASVEQCCFTPDSRYVLTGGLGSENRLRVWETSGRFVCILEAPDGEERVGLAAVHAIAVSHCGRRALSCGSGPRVKLWDLRAGTLERVLEGHASARVSDVAFSPDGRFGASCAEDLAIRVWDLETGRCVCVFTGHTAHVKSVEFSPDGRRLVSVADDGVMKTWFLDWELEERAPSDWDEGATRHLEAFLARRPSSSVEVGDAGETWGEEDFEGLLEFLRGAGFGWLRPGGVRHQLRRMSAEICANGLPKTPGLGSEDEDGSRVEPASLDLGAGLPRAERPAGALRVSPSRDAPPAPDRGPSRARKKERALMSDDGWLSRLMRGRRRPDERSARPSVSPDAAMEAERLCTSAMEHRQAGDNDEAVELYERALRLNPQLVHGWVNLAIILGETRRPKAALKCLRKAQDLASANPNFEIVLSQLVPIIEHEAAEATGNEESETWVRNGLRAERAERREDAIGHYERALLLDPRNPRALVLLGLKYLDAGRAMDAMELFDRANAVDDPETNAMLVKSLPSIRKNAAQTLRDQGGDLAKDGEWAEALRHFDRSLELNPYDADALCFKGLALLRSRLYGEALSCFEAAEQLGHPGVENWTEQCRIALGEG